MATNLNNKNLKPETFESIGIFKKQLQQTVTNSNVLEAVFNNDDYSGFSYRH